MFKSIVSPEAPQAIGPYSQAAQVGQFVFLSGQIPIDPKTGQICSEDVSIQAEQVFKNLSEVCLAAGGHLNQICKINIFLSDMEDFDAVNQVMMRFFHSPYPARATVAVLGLPRQVKVEIEGVMVLA